MIFIVTALRQEDITLPVFWRSWGREKQEELTDLKKLEQAENAKFFNANTPQPDVMHRLIGTNSVENRLLGTNSALGG